MTDLTMSQLHAYYDERSIESDAYAYVDEVDDVVHVFHVTGDPNDTFDMSPREARCLAWSLLVAAARIERDEVT